MIELTDFDVSSDTCYSAALHENTLLNAPDETAVLIPRVHDHVRFDDPSSDLLDEFVVVSRNWKGVKDDNVWFNVKSIKNGVKKCVNFSTVKWTKVSKEVLYSSQDSSEVTKAKREELEKWKQYDVMEEVDDTGQSAINTRWVITSKDVDDNTIVKARLVARGFEEDTTEIRTDSPTISKECIRLVSAIAVAHHWTIHSLDVTAAFLQGFAIDRDVFLVPPVEAQLKDKLWKLKKPVYGLSDASRAWYLKASAEILSQGAAVSTYDSALFFLRNGSDLEGIICSHVDDFFFNGSQLFHSKVIDHIRNEFALSQELFDQMSFIGIEIAQSSDGITMHQNAYIEELEPIQLTDMRKGRSLDVSEVRQLKGLIGQLQWIAKLTRPDIAFETSQLSANVKRATTDHVKRANKVVRKVKSEPLAVRIPDVGPISESSLYVYSDSSFANLDEDCGSQGGFIIFLVGQNGNAAPLIWTSHKLKRVVKSPKAAETLALQDGAEYAIFLKSILAEMYNLDHEKIPVICITDNESLHSSIHSTTTVADKRLLIDICCLRGMLTRKEVTEVQLTSSHHQLADCLTKSTASSDLLRRVIAGEVKLPTFKD